MMKKQLLAISIGVALGTSPLSGMAATGDASAERIMQELEALKQRVENLQGELEKERARNDQIEQKQSEQAEKVAKAEEKAEAAKPDINVGGAVRFNYGVKDYSDGEKDRGGDFAFDTFRLNLDGEIGGMTLSAEWRWYEYMSVIHHAWVGYDFNDDWSAKAGVFQVPFGVLPYNSHNYYFSSLYYAGLEDNYDFGVGATYTPGDWRFDLALLKNDERTWGDGYSAGDEETYSANVIGFQDESGNDYDVGMTNTLAARAEYTYNVSENLTLKPGASFKYGQLKGDMAGNASSGASDGDGDYYAAAAHLVADYDRWNLQLQYTDWEYDLDSPTAETIEYGYFGITDAGPLSAQAVTANVAYTLPVEWGPVSSLTFYNDHSRIFDKNAGLEDTWMNVTGMSVVAGGVFAYFDYVMAENQPYVNGSLAGDGETASRFNINVGYYF